MSSPSTMITPAAAKLAEHAPYIGAYLRWASGVVRKRVLEAWIERGFTDLNQAHLNVFQYPPPDGVRPSELAERAYMTKQAMNYLLVQLESLGYLERRTERGQSRRLVYLTRRGWQVFEAVWGAMQRLEAEWIAVLGKRKFDELRATLLELSSRDSKGAQLSRLREPSRGTDPQPPRARAQRGSAQTGK
jgi:DNA-binding MarR family transcriptional regulator